MSLGYLFFEYGSCTVFLYLVDSSSQTK